MNINEDEFNTTCKINVNSTHPSFSKLIKEDINHPRLENDQFDNNLDTFSVQKNHNLIHIAPNKYRISNFEEFQNKYNSTIIRVGKIRQGNSTTSKSTESEIEMSDDEHKKKNQKKRRGRTFGYDVPNIKTFRPTWEQFHNFVDFIDCIEATGAQKAGICKIIPPEQWKPRPNGYNIEELGDIVIPYPVSQVVQGSGGLYQQVNIQKKKTDVRSFRDLATSTEYATPPHKSYKDLEKQYWENISHNPPIYGADVSGSITDPNCTTWNINHLGTILDYVNKDYNVRIDGVNTAYLYFGMWKASFAWHTEDMDLYSINYLHFGCPKTWYAIPPKHARRFEKVASKYFPQQVKSCPAHLRHKMTLISPAILEKHSIPYDTITQLEGEIVITFPYGYHAGFNHGFNCAESTNFATPRWVEYGKRATICECRADTVKIGMATFVERFQPDKYVAWLMEEEIPVHPEEPFANSFSERSNPERGGEFSAASRDVKQKTVETKALRPRRENKNNKENSKEYIYYESETYFDEPRMSRRKKTNYEDDDWTYNQRVKKRANKTKPDGRSAKRRETKTDVSDESDDSFRHTQQRKRRRGKKIHSRRKSVGSKTNNDEFQQNDELTQNDPKENRNILNEKTGLLEPKSLISNTESDTSIIIQGEKSAFVNPVEDRSCSSLEMPQFCDNMTPSTSLDK